MMNWLDELIAKLGGQEYPSQPQYPGYTQSRMMVNRLPMGSPSQDPAQFSGPPYQIPYGPGQMFQEADLPTSTSGGRPLGYTPMYPTGFRDATGANVGRERVYSDVAARANESFPGAGLSPDNAEWLNYNEMMKDKNAGTATRDANALRRLMTLMALHGSKRTANRGGKQ